ncbi:MAG: hypothetical protein WCG21_14505 [Eubacteriales bacterium]
MAGLVPKTTSAENKLMWGLSYPRVLGLVFTLVITTNMNQYFIHTYLQPIYIFINLGFYFLLTRKDVINPKKLIAQGLLSFVLQLLEPKRYLSILGSAYSEEKREMSSAAKLYGKENNPNEEQEG